MSNININYRNNTIEISKTFAKSAGAYGTNAYNELASARKDFPNFRLVVKSSNSNNTFKGMDYDFMKNYISCHDDAEERTKAFDKLREKDLTYGEIKQWFIATYPVFKDCKTRADWILAA